MIAEWVGESGVGSVLSPAPSVWALPYLCSMCARIVSLPVLLSRRRPLAAFVCGGHFCGPSAPLVFVLVCVVSSLVLMRVSSSNSRKCGHLARLSLACARGCVGTSRAVPRFACVADVARLSFARFVRGAGVVVGESCRKLVRCAS